ncbi:hypothetical protein [Clostridium transplantifaecale]|uniref:hypothetical protein n=1 Tax=Clostridium transplantifaecale TaxID=2479838 RepID=UPI000F64319C|nr:hypothetical protein [Clostridium transplantifaecale]
MGKAIKRTWHAGKPKKKPNYDAEVVTGELLEAVSTLYQTVNERGKHLSLQAIADELDCGLNAMKVRKLLITVGELRRTAGEMKETAEAICKNRSELFDKPVYSSVMADNVLKLYKEAKCIEEIMSILHLSRASVYSYLPYSKIIYKLDKVPGGESGVDAERMRVYRERMKVCEKLKKEMNCDNLWNAIVAFAGYPFKTSKGLKFSYTVKGGELFFSRKEKSITRATVDMAFQRVMELNSIVPGPKKLGVFGASYLYPVFVRLGLIDKKGMNRNL